MVLAVRTRSSGRNENVAPVSRFFAKMDTVPLNPAIAAEILSDSFFSEKGWAAWATVSVSKKMRGRNMRTIVAFLLTSFAAAAQTVADIDRLEKRLADHPTNVGDRQNLLRALVNSTNLPLERVRSDRREQILWLIEHQSYLQIFDDPFTQLWPRGGRLGDPEGFAQAARLWKEQIAIPGESPKTIANAAVFFNVPDRAQAFAILDAAEKDHPGDPDLARARGILYAFTVVGISGFEDTNAIRYSYSAAMRASTAATEARREIETSKDPHLIGAAGVVFSHANAIAIPGDLTFGDDDVPALAERLIRHARELAPGDDEWNTGLGDTLHMKAVRTLDPAEKLRLLNEACTFLPDNARNAMRLEIANAEFAATTPPPSATPEPWSMRLGARTNTIWVRHCSAAWRSPAEM
jgi:hypothetical protein